MENIENLEKELAQCEKDDKEKVDILNELAQTYKNNLPEKTMEYGKKAFGLSKLIDYKKGEAQALNNISAAYYISSEYNKSIEISLEALHIFEEIEDKKNIAQILNNTGLTYDVLSKYEISLDYHLKSLKIREEIQDKEGIAASLNNIGNINWETKNYDSALEYYEKSLSIYKEIDNKKGIAITNNNMGNILHVLNKHDQSSECFIKSLKIHEELNNKYGIAAASNNIAFVFKEAENYKQALKYSFKSLKISEDLEEKAGIANTLNNIGELYFLLENYDEALEYFQKSMKLAGEIETKSLLKNSYRSLSNLYSIKEKYHEALKYFKLYTEVKDSIFTDESSKKIAEMQTKYETETKEKEAEIYKLKNVELVSVNEQLEKEIIERKKAEEEIEISKKRLKMVSSILRYDITNDLTVIKSALRIYKRNSDILMLTEIENKVNKGLNTIKRLREQEFFIESHSDLSEYSISEVLQEVISDFHNLDIHIKDNATAFADKALYSVFENIITNAIKHGNSSKIEISISTKDQICEIRIKDFGIGIPNEIKEKIFEKGFIYGKTGHTGIGLYIVKQTIEGYGGEIYAEDNEPTGVIFVIRLRKTDIKSHKFKK
ncbi:MAG: tetratricopeptide repeat-containing sensor histidine kinase [Candidatus Tenebribacter davisii]|nr:tetratricopeptide repeat-containing sensor histidine kinase [Candidatus Tenebribacter davisii]